MSNLSRNPVRDDRGAAVIELALIAPVLALLTIGIIDVSQAFGRKLTLEQAAQRAVEKVMQTTGNTTVETTIKEEASAQGDVAPEDVTVSYRMECNGEVQADFNTECDEGEAESRYLMVTVSGSYTPMFPSHFFGDEGDGIYHMTATAGVRTK